MTSKTKYLHWSEAGGPNECEHGYAEGIPCPNCDANPRIQELCAENERLRAALGVHHPYMGDDVYCRDCQIQGRELPGRVLDSD